MAPADFDQPVGQRSPPVPPAQPQPSGRGLNIAIVVIVLAVVGVFMVAVIGLLAAIAIPAFMRSRNNARKIACISNLRIISGAKSLYATEEGGTNGMLLTWDNLNPYIMDMSNKLVCLSAQDDARTPASCYVMGRVGEKATCRIDPKEHTLKDPGL